MVLSEAFPLEPISGFKTYCYPIPLAASRLSRISFTLPHIPK